MTFYSAKSGYNMLAGIVKKYSISEKDIKLVEINPFEIISLDCTEALRKTTYIGHLNLKRCINMRSQFLNDSIADKNTVFVLNHFSHNGNAVYDDFSHIAGENEFLVSYDGMELEF